MVSLLHSVSHFVFSINDVLVVAFLMWIGLSKEFVNSVLFYSWL